MLMPVPCLEWHLSLPPIQLPPKCCHPEKPFLVILAVGENSLS